jgi:hypothetical protein
MGRNGIAYLVGAILCGALPVAAETREFEQSRSGIDAAKIGADIRSMHTSGLSDKAIQYVFQLDGLDVPTTVITGRKRVQDAVDDGSIRRQIVQTTPVPPAIAPAPTPNLAPKGSSASDWKPTVMTPSIQSLRSKITSTSRPPNC